MSTAREIPTSPVLNLGFVGLGQAVNRILYQHPEVHSLPYRFVAAADPREGARQAFVKEFGGRAYDSAEGVIEDPDVQVVYLATPPAAHLEQVEATAAAGKHVLVEKPLALDMDDAQRMVDICGEAGVRLMAGHTKVFDGPMREMRRLLLDNTFGGLQMVNTWNFNSFNVMPWPTNELQETAGPVLNQGPHQVDMVRLLAGGLATSVSASTIWDPLRDVVGGYTAHLRFESGASAALSYDARGFFDAAELYGWVGEGGQDRDPDTNARMRQNIKKLAGLPGDEGERILEQQKEEGRYGADRTDPYIWHYWGYKRHDETTHQPFFGLTVVSCDDGAMRQSSGGLYVYDDGGVHEREIPPGLRARSAELLELWQAITSDREPFHDGRWGLSTLEVCFAILESAKSGREIRLTKQVPNGPWEAKALGLE